MYISNLVRRDCIAYPVRTKQELPIYHDMLMTLWSMFLENTIPFYGELLMTSVINLTTEETVIRRNFIELNEKDKTENLVISRDKLEVLLLVSPFFHFRVDSQ